MWTTHLCSVLSSIFLLLLGKFQKSYTIVLKNQACISPVFVQRIHLTDKMSLSIMIHNQNLKFTSLKVDSHCSISELLRDNNYQRSYTSENDTNKF